MISVKRNDIGIRTGKPVTANISATNAHLQHGNFNKTSKIVVFVLSNSKLSTNSWEREDQQISQNNSCYPQTVAALFYQTVVNISAYKCELIIANTGENDFTNYTLKVGNSCGQSRFTISLQAASEPEAPRILHWTSDTNSLSLRLKPGFNGGSRQTFVVKYFDGRATTWNSVSFTENSKTEVQEASIDNLNPDTEYQIVIYAFNDVGNSSLTPIYFIKTIGVSSNTEMHVGIVYGVAMAVIVALLAVIRLRRYIKKANSRDVSDVPNRIQAAEQPVAVVAVENNIYGSAEAMMRPEVASSGTPYEYSSIDRRNQSSLTEEVHYNVDQKCNLEKQIDCTADKRNKRKTDSTAYKLNYTNVIFEPTQSRRKVYIHGADNRTPYADIDFEAKADPLSSDSDDNQDSQCEDCNDNQDFESINQWICDGE